MCWPHTEGSIETLHRFQCTAANKDREPPEEPLLLSIEQIITPRQHVTEGLLPCGDVACSTRQDLQSMVQTGQESPWGKQFDAGRCQFDGQRRPTQAATRLRHGTAGGGRHLKV